MLRESGRVLPHRDIRDVSKQRSVRFAPAHSDRAVRVRFRGVRACVSSRALKRRRQKLQILFSQSTIVASSAVSFTFASFAAASSSDASSSWACVNKPAANSVRPS